MATLFELYKKWMNDGKMSGEGLCLCLPDEYMESFELFNPTLKDINDLRRDGLATGYWASGVDGNDNAKYYNFSELRQTIVLFICAMHNEI